MLRPCRPNCPKRRICGRFGRLGLVFLTLLLKMRLEIEIHIDLHK